MNRPLWLLASLVLLFSSTVSWAGEQPLICFGTEPFWSLDLAEPGTARFSTPDSAPAEYLGAASPLAARAETVWRGRAAAADGGELVAFLREGPCSDGMSDAVHPTSVNLSLPDGRHLGGCCRVPVAPAAASAALENATWRLTGLPSLELPSAADREAVTVRLVEGRVTGFSGCNQLMGSYTLDGETLVLGELAGTMMACPEPARSIEGQFLGAFSGTMRVVVEGDHLTLVPESGGGPLLFEREAPPRLEGVRWEVTGYNNGRQAVVGPITGSRLTLEFQDGRVSGDSGCNRFHGSFTVDGNGLTIGPLATTRMACDDETMAQEQQFLAAIASAATWDLVRGSLDIHRADGERALWAVPVNE
ncbi:MAG: META domain-containing protein [Thermoanaerobaculales bacterium]|jgi:heat shock protein HslJ|nr:META domain-containing protein [Thermoanaerobaculales bacterium]